MYDIIGSKEKAVAIVEDGGENLAEEIMRKHKNVKSVLKKLSGRKGTYRLYNLRLLAGDENTEVVHREHGMLLKLDPRKVYFSPREATERQRIANLVEEGEKILVMFAGIAPYAIAIAKKKNCEITCIEVNPHACRYARENVKLNKVEDRVKIIEGDVKRVCENLKEKFSRILMPLPECAWKFLKYAFKLAEKNAVIHVYGISSEQELFKDLEEKIVEEAEKQRAEIEIISRQRVLPYAPRKWKVRIDVRFKKFKE